MIRGYRRRRGWAAWHAAILTRVQEPPALHVLMDDEPPPEDPEEAAERRLANLRAWKRAIEARNAQFISAHAPSEAMKGLDP